MLCAERMLVNTLFLLYIYFLLLMNNKVRNLLRAALSFCIVVSASAFAGYFVTKVVLYCARNVELGTHHNIWPGIVVGLIFLIVSVVLHIIFHEIGHMLAALSRGWTFLSFMIFGMVISKRDGLFRLSRFSMAGAGGQCLMLPPDSGDSDAGIMLYNAGGILTNAVLSLVGGAVLYLFHSSLSFYASIFFGLFVLVGVFFILFNGIPHRLSGLPNDGMNMMNLRKDAFSTSVFLHTLRMYGFLMNGNVVRFKNMPYACDGKTIDVRNNIHTMALSLDLSLAIANMDFCKARSIVDRIIPYSEGMVQIFRNEFAVEHIFLTLIGPHSHTDIERMLTPSVKRYIEHQSAFRPSVVRVKYALARLYMNDEAEAERIYYHFDEVCRGYHVVGESEIEKVLMEYLRNLNFEPKKP